MKRSTLSPEAMRRVVKAAAARNRLSDKALAERENVTVATVKGALRRAYGSKRTVS